MFKISTIQLRFMFQYKIAPFTPSFCLIAEAAAEDGHSDTLLSLLCG